MDRVIILGSYAHSLLNFRGHLLHELVSQGHDVTACAPKISGDIKYLLNKLGVACKVVPISLIQILKRQLKRLLIVHVLLADIYRQRLLKDQSV